MATLADIVFDCQHPASLAWFWAAVLDDYEVGPYDANELARLAAMGVTNTEDDPTVLVVSSSQGPRIWFQAVPEAKTTKNRVHLDIRSDDRRADVDRLRSLGAHVVGDRPDHHLTVLQDPEGNEFCLIE